MVDVAVNSGRDSDNTSRRVVGLEVLSEVTGIGEASSGADEDKTSQAKVSSDLESLSLGFGGAELVSTSADVIVATQVDVVGESFTCHLHAIVGKETIDTGDEADELNVVALGLESE